MAVDIEQLQQRLAALERQVAELRAQLQQDAPRPSDYTLGDLAGMLEGQLAKGQIEEVLRLARYEPDWDEILDPCLQI